MIRIAGKTIRDAMISMKLTLPGENILENVLLKLNSSSKLSKQLTKSSSPKMALTPQKSQKSYGLETDSELLDVENLDWESIYLLPS